MNVKALLLGLIVVSAAGYFLLKSGKTTETTTNLTYFQKLARKINNDPTSTWTANDDLPRQFLSMDLKKRFNLVVESKLPSNFDQAPKYPSKVSDLPTSLDLRDKFPNCDALKEVRDQSACGSCWAFGAVSAMSDRLCIASGQKDQRRISAEDLLACCTSCGDGCDGGMLYESWSYFKETGLVTGDLFGDTTYCLPYSLPPCNHHSKGPYDDCSKHDYSTPSCKKQCSNKAYGKKYSDDKIFGKTVYDVAGEDQIIQELNNFGSVELAFDVYEDFLLYKTGVYQHKTGNMLGGHAIKCIGYGEENGTKYWLIVNSWNDSWGDKGTFKILRGGDECGIESSGAAGLISA